MKSKFISLILFCSLLLGGCATNTVTETVSKFTCDEYSFADSYSVGNFSYIGASIQKIKVYWLVGSINVKTSSSSECKVEENNDGLEDSYKMRWKIEDEVLMIQYCESGLSGKIKGENLKALTIEVPEGIELEIENEVGNIALEDCVLQSCNSEIEVGSFSGKNCSVDSLNSVIDTGSISLDLKYCKVGILKTNTGDIDIHLLNNLGATVNYSIETGSFNDKDKQGNASFGDGACMLTLKSETGSIHVQ